MAKRRKPLAEKTGIEHYDWYAVVHKDIDMNSILNQLMTISLDDDDEGEALQVEELDAALLWAPVQAQIPEKFRIIGLRVPRSLRAKMRTIELQLSKIRMFPRLWNNQMARTCRFEEEMPNLPRKKGRRTVPPSASV
jgi:hypothetical protein